MNDLQIGDRCNVVVDGKIYQGVVTTIINSIAQIFIPASGRTIEIQIDKLERHPRPLELIEVWDSDAWVYRQAIQVDENGYVWVASPFDGETTVFFTDWRLMSAKETKAEIIKRIEEDDEDILGELAEIILAAREKVTP